MPFRAYRMISLNRHDASAVVGMTTVFLIFAIIVAAIFEMLRQ